jgi:hypothetical protein
MKTRIAAIAITGMMCAGFISSQTRPPGQGMVALAAQAVPQTAPTPDRNIASPWGQRAAPRPQPQKPTPGTLAPQPISTKLSDGVIEGFVYWDTSLIVHKPAGTCNGLEVTVNVDNGLSGPFKGLKPLANLTNNFKYGGQVKNFLAGGKVVTYDVCTYGYGKVPVGQELQVQLTVTPAFALNAVPQPSVIGPITIINGQCNMLPSLKAASLADLTAHWGSCQNMAYNVTFAIQQGALKSLSAGGSTGKLDSNSESRGRSPGTPGTTLLKAPGSAGMLSTSPTTQGSTGSSGSQGKLATSSAGSQRALGGAGNRNAGLLGDGSAHTPPGGRRALNPQPVPPRTAANASAGSPGANAAQATAAVSDYRQRNRESSGPNGSASPRNSGPPGASSKAARAAVRLSAPKQGRKITNPKANLQDAAIIAVLRKQRQAADAEAAFMKLGIRQAGVQVSTGSSQTMAASGAGSSASGHAPTANGAISRSAASAAHPYPGVSGTLPSQFSNLVVTCSHDPTMRALTVSGGPTPAIFTPDTKYNFYTITGCSFGSPGTNSKAYIYYQGTFREDFQIQEWNDNWIKLSLDQNIGGVDDQNDVTLVIQSNDGKQWTKSGYRFYAARRTVLLAQIPQSDFSLSHFRPDNSVTQSWKPTYTSGSSPSVIPNLPGLSAEVHWDITTDSANKLVGGNDLYDFSHLHSTFALDSGLMEWKDVSCTDPDYDQFAASKNNWSIDWYGASGVQVSWQGQVCKYTPGSCGGAFQGDCFTNTPESNYGINVWVNGPRCIDPWTGQKDQQCMNQAQ